MAEPADINVDELRRRARRRLVGAVVLALGVAVVVPMLLETDEKPLGEDVSVKIPPIDEGKFVNRLAENRAKDAAGKPPAKSDTAKDDAGAAPPPVPSGRYDTRLPDAAEGPSPAMATDASAGAPAVAAVRPSPPAAVAAKAPEPVKSVADAAPPPRSEAKPAAPASEVKAPATPSGDGFAVQLAAFADDKGANALAGRLRKSGYTAYTEPLRTSKGTLYRVRVGPYPSRDAANAARDKLKREGQNGIVAAVK